MSETNAQIFSGEAFAPTWTAVLTTVALLAFAGNSILCRLALGASAIDPASYTAVRLIAGALTLWFIGNCRSNNRQSTGSRKSWVTGALLFLYAITFAYAYMSLTTGTGALILFASVQLTMIAMALRSGERPVFFEWTGWLVAVSGLVYLVFPGIAAPSLAGSMLMMAAGVSWGFYSVLGRGVADPVQATTDNFLRSVPLIAAVALVQLRSLTATPIGLTWALVSGAVTSGLGYVVWYAALPRLTATRAATLQLAVPVIAGFGGVVLLSEPVVPRLLVAAAAILGGIGLSLLGRQVRAYDINNPVALKTR